MDSILRIFAENQDRYLSGLRQQGQGSLHEKRVRKIFGDFILFLKVMQRPPASQVFVATTIHRFIAWKARHRRNKRYSQGYRSRVLGELTGFLEDHVRRTKVAPLNRAALNRLSEEYIREAPWRYPRWPIETRAKHAELFTYLEQHRIRNYRGISRKTLERFMEHAESGFYPSRKRYCSEFSGRILYGLSKYFRYLAEQKLIPLPEDGTPPHPRHFLSGMIQQYVEFTHEARGLSPKTVKGIRTRLDHFGTYLVKLGFEDLSRLQAHHVDAFVASSGWSFKNLPTLYSILRRFLRYLYIEKQIERDLSALLIPPKVFAQAHIPRFLTPEELACLFQAGPGRPAPAELRARAIVQLLLFTGLRTGEAAALRLDDVNWNDKRALHIRQRKNGQDLLLPLPGPAVEALYDYVTGVRPNGLTERRIFMTIHAPLVPLSSGSLSTAVARYFQSRGVMGGAHRLRHTYARHLLESGSSLEQIQGLLGHQSLNSSWIYAKTSMSRMRRYVVMDG